MICSKCGNEITLVGISKFAYDGSDYHLIRNVKYSKNISKAMKKICRIKTLVNQANKFHRVNECGELKELVGDDK